MSGSKSRRRRSGSSSQRSRQPELVVSQPRRRGRVGVAEISACIGVTLVAVVLVALIWIVSTKIINDQTADVRERAERMVTAQALTLAQEIHQELAVVDQSIAILQEAWARDQEHFNLLDWQKQMPSLTKLSDDIFIGDEKRVVRQDINPAAIGQGIGGIYLTFPHDTLETIAREGQTTRAGHLLIAESGGAVEARRYLMYIVRPLKQPTSWLIGASYRTQDLIKFYESVSIGINGVVALVDSERGTLQAVAGPAARHPQTQLLDTEMLNAFKTRPSGAWTGPTAMDNVVRVLGFARVPDRDMIVTVGIARSEALSAADTIASGMWWDAFGASVVVITIAGLILWEIFNLRSNRRRQRNFVRMQSDLESAQNEVAGLRNRSGTASGQVAALMRVSPDGTALLDPELRLSAWNQRFAAEIGVPAEALKVGLPIDELFRHQAQAGLIGSAEGENDEAMEAEIAQRVAILRTEPAGASLPQLSPDGRQTSLNAEVVPDGGGLILVVTETETEI